MRSAPPPWARAPHGVAADLERSSTCSIVCMQLTSVNDSSGRTPRRTAQGGSTRGRRRAAHGARRTARTHRCQKSRGAQAFEERAVARPDVGRSTEIGQQRSDRPQDCPHRSRRISPPRCSRSPPRDMHRSETRQSARARVEEVTRLALEEAVVEPSGTFRDENDIESISDGSNRASTKTRASVDPHTGHGRPSCSNRITDPEGYRPAAEPVRQMRGTMPAWSRSRRANRLCPEPGRELLEPLEAAARAPVQWRRIFELSATQQSVSHERAAMLPSRALPRRQGRFSDLGRLADGGLCACPDVVDGARLRVHGRAARIWRRRYDRPRRSHARSGDRRGAGTGHEGPRPQARGSGALALPRVRRPSTGAVCRR